MFKKCPLLLISAETANMNPSSILEINKTFSSESFKGKWIYSYRKVENAEEEKIKGKNELRS